MQNYAGIVRTKKWLERGKAEPKCLRHRIEKFYGLVRMGAGLMGLRHGIQVALLITHAALGNPASRGFHFIKE